jgi:hypothetical protein
MTYITEFGAESSLNIGPKPVRNFRLGSVDLEHVVFSA